MVGEHDSRDGSGFPSAFLRVVDMHAQCCGRARNREHGPAYFPIELEFVQAQHLTVELPCLQDVSDVDRHGFEPFDRRGHTRTNERGAPSLRLGGARIALCQLTLSYMDLKISMKTNLVELPPLLGEARYPPLRRRWFPRFSEGRGARQGLDSQPKKSSSGHRNDSVEDSRVTSPGTAPDSGIKVAGRLAPSPKRGGWAKCFDPL